MDAESARRVCQLVAGVLCADGEMRESERRFLKRVMTSVGLETDIGLIPTYNEDVAEELAQLDEAARWQALDLVIKSAVVDGVITPEERQLIDTVAKELGVSHEDLMARFRQELPPA